MFLEPHWARSVDVRFRAGPAIANVELGIEATRPSAKLAVGEDDVGVAGDDVLLSMKRVDEADELEARSRR